MTKKLLNCHVKIFPKKDATTQIVAMLQKSYLAPVLDFLYDLKGAKLSLSFNIQVGSKGSRFVPRSKNKMFCTIRGTLKKDGFFVKSTKKANWEIEKKEIDWTNSCAKMASSQVTVSSCTFLIDATKLLLFASNLKTLGKKT